MSDMNQTILAKSDQLNAADIQEPRTITITSMKVESSSQDQPVTVHYEGDNGKPFKPSKTVRRIMVALWGSHSEEYIGRSMTLYNDPSVTWANKAIGGIRVSHMSDISRPQAIVLPTAKSKHTEYIVKPLENAPAKREPQRATADQSKPDQNPGKFTLRDQSYETAAEFAEAVKTLVTKPALAKRFQAERRDDLQALTQGDDSEIGWELVDYLSKLAEEQQQ